MRILNLTPHQIRIIDDSLHSGGPVFEPEATPARVSVKQRTLLENLRGIPLFAVEYSDIEGLPEPQEGVFYIVSRMVADVEKTGRKDLLIPSQMVRDGKGIIIGCKGFEPAH